MRVFGLACLGTENWQCQAWHRRTPPRLIDLLCRPTGPWQQSVHFPLCTALPCASLTEASLLSLGGQAGSKLSASCACSHTPSLLPYFPFLSPNFSLMLTRVLMFSLGICASLSFTLALSFVLNLPIFLPSFIPLYFLPASLLPLLPVYLFSVFLTSMSHSYTLSPDFSSLLSIGLSLSPQFHATSSFTNTGVASPLPSCLHCWTEVRQLFVLSSPPSPPPSLQALSSHSLPFHPKLLQVPPLAPEFHQYPLPRARLTHAGA